MLDYLGTLACPRDYSLQSSRLKLHKALCEASLKTEVQQFLKAYTKAHEKYRATRYTEHKEVTNAVWVSEALNNIGYSVSAEDSRLKAGLNVFFQDFVDSLELRPHAKKLIKCAAAHGKVGLVSNFTYSPAIYASLRKLGINRFFNAVLVSQDIGWRKPHRIIFEEALRKLQVKAEEVVFIGDSPTEDVGGAKAVGMKTVFVTSRFFSADDLRESGHTADFVVEDVQEICGKLPQVLGFH
jgi:HAD superfamily hydrolase (TIGR01662 family)